MDKIVKDFNSIILRKRSIAFCVVAALIAIYACSSSSSYNFIDDELAEGQIVLTSGDRVEGIRVVNGQTINTMVGGTIADYVDLGIMVGGKKVLFATHNLGASREDEIGARIAWGELGSKEEGYLRGVKYKDGEVHYGYDNLKYCEAESAEKAKGSNSSNVAILTSPFMFPMMILGIPNSAITWRQAPQGAQGPSVSATTASASSSFSPSETALKMAVRSAQFPNG